MIPMKNVMKNVLIFIIIMCCLFTISGCNNETGKETTNDKSNRDFGKNVIMSINGVDITTDQFNLIFYEEAFNYRNNIEVPEGLSDEEYEDWVNNFWHNPIDGKLPIDIAKDLAVEAAKMFACNIKKCQETGFKLSEEDRIDLETRIMQDVGIDYDENNPDGYFKSTYGVSRESYLKYKLDKEMFFLNAIKIMKDTEISEKEIKDYYNEYKDYFSDKTVRSIFISLLDASSNPVQGSERDEKVALANELLQRIKNGEDMNDLVNVYSEDPDKGDNNGLFTIKNDSSYVEEFMDWALNADKGDADVVESSIGLHIVRCEEIGGLEGAKQEIIEHLKIKKYNDIIKDETKKDTYKPIINEDIFTSLKLPGDLDLSQSMG